MNINDIDSETLKILSTTIGSKKWQDSLTDEAFEIIHRQIVNEWDCERVKRISLEKIEYHKSELAWLDSLDDID